MGEEKLKEVVNKGGELEVMVERKGMKKAAVEAKGRLPHPETLRENNHPLYGEVKRLWDSMLKPTKRRTNAGRTVDRTNEANDYFLPIGETVDMDHVREALNERGFAFDTITDMLGALDVSLSYGKPVYGTASMTEGGASYAMSPLGPGVRRIAEAPAVVKLENPIDSNK